MNESSSRRALVHLLVLTASLVVAGCGDAGLDAGGPRLRKSAPRSSGSSGSPPPPGMQGFSSGAVTGRVSGTGPAGLRVRQKPATSSPQIGTVNEGQTVTIACQVEGEAVDGSSLWDFLEIERGYIAHAYVDTDAGAIPRCESAPVDAPPTTGGGKPAVIEGPAVRAHVRLFADEACEAVGGCRASTRAGHEPSADLALDFPTGEGYGKLPTDNHVFGDRLADYARANMAKRRIEYVIYRQRIDFGDGWEPMEDRGDITQNHFDHVHVSFLP